MKNLLFFIVLFSSVTFGQFKFGSAKGLFMGVAVGPRFPIGEFADAHNIGIGAEVIFSYSDNELLPVFFYTMIGYQHYPGRQDFYKRSDYSSFSSNVFMIAPGIRYYFKPILENVVLLMPIIDIGAEYALFENWHQFKSDVGKQNFTEDVHKLGIHVGAGFSMFILDVVTYYNYLPKYQYLSFNLRANIPIFVKM